MFQSRICPICNQKVHVTRHGTFAKHEVILGTNYGPWEVTDINGRHGIRSAYSPRKWCENSDQSVNALV